MFRATRSNVLAFTFATLIGFFSPEAQAITSDEPCTGIALVRPPNGLYGSIYTAAIPQKNKRTGETRFPRRGYIPSGSVVTLHKSYSASSPDWKRNNCGFSVRNSVYGHLPRTHLIALDTIISGAGLSLKNTGGFIAPANPDLNHRLKLYKTDSLSKKDVIDEFGMNKEVYVILKKKVKRNAYMSDGDVPWEAWYLPNPKKHPEKKITVFIRGNDDRCCDVNGTFRVYRPTPYAQNFTRKKKYRMAPWLLYFLPLVLNSAPDVKRALRDFIERKLATNGCRLTAELSAKLNLKAGVDLSFLGITAGLEGEIKWSKPADEVFQFGSSGTSDGLMLKIGATAHCEGSKPAYIEQAHVIADNNGIIANLYVSRNEFFEVICREDELKDLRKQSSLVNAPVDDFTKLSKLLVVPRKNGSNISFYYKLLDQIERYMSEKIYSQIADEFPFDEDDRFGLMLLLVETLSYWQQRG